MATFREARSAIFKARSTLYKAYDDAPPQEQEKIEALLHAINREYLILLNMDPHLENASYAALTQEFANSAALVNEIREDAESITHNAALITSLVNAMGALAVLI